MSNLQPLDGASRLIPSSRVYARAFGDDLVLLDFTKGEYFGLDAVGCVVWRGIAAGRAMRVIAQELAADYDVSEEVALHDVLSLAADLEAKSLIRRL